MQKWQVSTSKLDPFLMSVGNSGKPPPPFVEFDINKIVNTAAAEKRKEKNISARTQSVLTVPARHAVSKRSSSVVTTGGVGGGDGGGAGGAVTAAAANSTAASTIQSCRASNMFMEDDPVNVARLVFELQKDKSQTTFQVSTSNNLMSILLGLNAKGAPPLAKLWKSKKGKNYLNERVEKLKTALVKTTVSSSFTFQQIDNVRTIVNIA
jgi:hypothetical protein